MLRCTANALMQLLQVAVCRARSIVCQLYLEWLAAADLKLSEQVLCQAIKPFSKAAHVHALRCMLSFPLKALDHDPDPLLWRAPRKSGMIRQNSMRKACLVQQQQQPR